MSLSAKDPLYGTTPPTELSDDGIDMLVAGVGLLPLLMSTLHLTGRLDVLDTIPPTARPQFSGDASGSLPAEVDAKLRVQAAQAIRGWRDAGYPRPAALPEAAIARMIDVLTGKALDPRYTPLLTEELGFGGDARAFVWEDTPSEADISRYPVLIVGAGMAGLVMGYRLKQAGIPFTIVDKNSGPGGTWFENRYPGARVDVPSHCYSFSFTGDYRWPEMFSPAPVLRKYFERFVEGFGLAGHIRYGVHAERAVFDEAASLWTVSLRSDVGEETVAARAFVSAVGQLNRPFIPETPGEGTFKGLRLHTSRWPDDLDVSGKRVAVIGTAATALQIIPELARKAAKVIIFQRSPTWCFIHPDYRRQIQSDEQWAMDHLPGYARWYRVLLYNWAGDGSPEHLKVDAAWDQDGKTVSPANAAMRERLTRGITEAVGGDPELLAKVVPDYPPGAKRPNLGDGGFYRALTRDNVELVTGTVERFSETGAVDSSGHEHEFDIVVYATGFRALEFLVPMEIVGADGRSINDFWKDEPGAYLGVTVPHFPNLFLMYGPGTNLGYNGNLFFNAECQARYISGAIKWMVQDGLEVIDVKPSVYADYEARKADALSDFTWALRGASNWYKNSAGKVISNSPWPLIDYWTWTLAPTPSDFVVRKVAPELEPEA